MDLKRITKAMFDFAIRLGKVLQEANQAMAVNEGDWIAALNVSISREEDTFYRVLAENCSAAEHVVGPGADVMPLKVMKLLDAAYHAAAKATATGVPAVPNRQRVSRKPRSALPDFRMAFAIDDEP
jgi:hypothetical protein